ncbi:hypothetical protein PM082_009834 [Marasmius tenuissimus]|nr:hypothetical protein PM082_009834 [Marasmius tenuissimus]
MSKRVAEALASGRNIRRKLEEPHVQVKPEPDPYEDGISFVTKVVQSISRQSLPTSLYRLQVKSELEDGELNDEMEMMTSPCKVRFQEASTKHGPCKPGLHTSSSSSFSMTDSASGILQQAYWKRTDELIRMTKENTALGVRVEALERRCDALNRRNRSLVQQTRRHRRRAKKEVARYFKSEKENVEMRTWLDKPYDEEKTELTIEMGEDGALYIRERQKHDRTRFRLQQCIARSDLLVAEL